MIAAYIHEEISPWNLADKYTEAPKIAVGSYSADDLLGEILHENKASGEDVGGCQVFLELHIIIRVA